MTRLQLVLLALLCVASVGSGMGVVFAKNQSRALFVELQKLRVERDQADMEWGRLQLELATRGSLERVQRIASRKLGMRAPSAGQVVVVD